MSASVTENPLETGAMAEAVVGTGGEREEAKGTTMRWERFMPRLVVRVLLVEADDSTRQVVAALLRKCGYRGPASFPLFFSLHFLVESSPLLCSL